MYTASITSQGQVTIPSKVRKTLGLKKGDKINFFLENGKVKIEPAPDLLSLAGALKSSRKPLSSKQLHNKFAKHMAHRKKRPQLDK